jgi:energy-coupling factor transport system permease protein
MTVAMDVLGGPAGVDVGAPIARANPVAKLAVSAAVSLALILTVDVVTAGTALALELACLPWCGLGPRALWRRGWVVLAGAVPAGLFTALLGQDSGSVLLGGQWLTITQGSATAGLAITLRILAIGVPGVVLLATTDPTDLADALAQVARLPHRFVLAALAAMRLFGVLAQEWQALRLARRARGLGDDGLLGRIRTFGGLVFALLVLAVRRAGVLATTMESRGFGAGRVRTWARPSRLTLRDGVIVLGGITLALAATAAGVAAGTWRFVLL